MPQRLGARLIVTIVLVAIATAVVTFALSMIMLAGRAASGIITVEAVERGTLTVVVSVAVAALLAVAFGVWLAHLMRQPMEDMVARMKTQGDLVLAGRPYEASLPLADPSLPLEMREAGAVVDDLLARLSQRHAELESAIASARYSEESLAAVVTHSQEAKFVITDGRVELANPSAAAALGRTEDELIGRSIVEAFGDVVLTGVDGAPVEPDTLVERAFAGATTVLLETPQGAAQWHVWRVTRHSDGVRDRIIVTGRDVTEEQRLLRLRSDLVSLISHDLRSPLSVVVGYLDLLRRPMSDEERERAITSAKRNAGKMSDLLEDLLSAARAEDLLRPSALVPVSLADLAEEVVGSVAPTHPERELRLDVRCRPVVPGEEKRLRQVIVNLVTNAFKYSPDSEPITVRVDCDDTHAILSVEDGGPGVPVEERERVFERFARLDETAEGRPGMGLGLYIVRTICENHGGHATVHDAPGGGAAFLVELPVTGLIENGAIVEFEAAG